MDIKGLDVFQSIVVIMSQWPLGASSGRLARALDTALGIPEVTPESRPLTRSLAGQGSPCPEACHVVIPGACCLAGEIEFGTTIWALDFTG